MHPGQLSPTGASVSGPEVKVQQPELNLKQKI